MGFSRRLRRDFACDLKAGKESGFGRRASYPAVGGRRMGLNFFFWDILQ